MRLFGRALCRSLTSSIIQRPLSAMLGLTPWTTARSDALWLCCTKSQLHHQGRLYERISSSKLDWASFGWLLTREAQRLARETWVTPAATQPAAGASAILRRDVLPHAGPVDRDLRLGGRIAGVLGALCARAFRSRLGSHGGHPTRSFSQARSSPAEPLTHRCRPY